MHKPKHKVILNAYRNVAYYDEASLPKIDHSLGRRMTPLQRATVSITRGLLSESGQRDEFLANEGNLILFATGFGEVSSNFSVIRDVRRDQLPVSPTDFQHSIYNAATGYLGIVEKMDTHSITVTSGFLSVDKAIYLAHQRIQREGTSVLVICADEHMDGPAILVRAEALLLTPKSQPGAQQEMELLNISCGHKQTQPKKSDSTHFQEQSEKNIYCFFDPALSGVSYERLTVAAGGEWVASSWGRSNPS